MNISHIDPGSGVFEDPRVEWIKTRVLHGLDITGDAFLGAPKSDCDVLRLFLVDNTEAGTILYVHCDFEELEIQEEDKDTCQVVNVHQEAAAANAHVDHTTTEICRLERDDAANDSFLNGATILQKCTTPNAMVEEAKEKETCHPSANEAEIKNANHQFPKKRPRCRFSLTYPVIEGAQFPVSVAFFLKQTEGKISLYSINKVVTYTESTNLIHHCQNRILHLISYFASKSLEFGFHSADCLQALDLMIREVCGPLVDLQLARSSNISDMLHSEFQNSMAKYQTQLTRAIQQVQAEILLVPPSHIRFDDPEMRNDLEAISCLRATVEEWEKVFEDVILTETSKEMKCCAGPLAVIEYWRCQCANLGNLHEQLTMPKVQLVIQLLDTFQPESTVSFHYQSKKLQKVYAVAKNNVKFLSTLERYFKILMHGSISTLLNSLPSMMNAIRMVWTLSRHYNTEEKMVYLLRLIARQLEEKVRVTIDLCSIFHETDDDAERKIQLAQELLECWYNTYLDGCQEIQNSNLGNLWEFDEKQLFEQTGYMSEVCGDFREIAIAFKQLLKFVGPKLCDITGDSTGIDAIKERTYNNLVFPLQNIPFDIFCKDNEQDWKMVTKKMKESVVDIEGLIKNIIEESFKKLQSSMGAFDLMCTFQTIEGRESIHNHLKECYKDILQQYVKELTCLNGMFREKKDCPPIHRSFPPICGAISWAHDLYLRAKRPMMLFKAHNDILLNPFGEEVKKLYLAFAKEVDLYTIGLHKEWEQHVRVVSVGKLRYPVLRLYTTTQSDDEVGDAADETQSIAAPESNFTDPAAPRSSAGNNNLTFNPQWSFSVNFAPELLMIIRETKYLSRLGFDVPEAAMSVTLQEEKYHKHIQDLKLMLAAYQKTKEQLSLIDCTILQPQFSILWQTLSDGVFTLNWNSQRINTYINTCNKVVAEFQSIVSQVHKNAIMIENVEAAISNEKLIRKTDFLGPTGVPLPPMPVTEFYDMIEMNRVSRLDVLSTKYRSMGRYFDKIEMVIAQTSTGFSSAFAAYYYHWEKRFSNAITRMLLISMASFYTLCGGRGGEWTPLCEIKIIRSGKDLVVNPAVNDIYKYFARIVRNIVESSKEFPRWMHGSCKPALPVKTLEEDEPFIFSFYEDLALNVDIVQLMLTASQAIHRAFSKINRYLDGWQRHDRVYDLWNTRKKNALLEKDKAEKYTCAYLDSRMACYSLLSETVRSQQSTVDVDFLTIDCRGVARSTADQADTWKKAYGEVLYSNSSALLRRLVSKIENFQNKLEMVPTDLPALKVVLSTIADIANARIEVELEYSDILERYETLIQWDIPVPEEEVFESAKLAEKWHRLCIQSKTKDTQLSSVSDKFRGVAEQMSVEFTADVKKLYNDFIFSGPGAVSSKTGLDEGLTMMSEYSKKLSDLMIRKVELVNTKELLGLPACDFSHLVDSSLYFERLKGVYHLYESQISFERSHTSMTWLDLDVKSLQKGVEKLGEIEARTGERALDIPAFRAIQQCMHDFKNSIPLIVILKNHALQPRHWNRLLSTAKVSSPSVCTSRLNSMTLGGVFALQLHRFPLLVSKVIDEASQELKIDTELNRIELFWKKTDLGLQRYAKNGVVILSGVDDMKLLLEDHLLNLQTISGSNFVGNYIDRVRYWDKMLNTINDTLDAWIIVQCKWMYLESIYMGTEDIQLQLVDEAKQFNTIDHDFKEIMSETCQNPNVIFVCGNELILKLHNIADRLDSAQKSLSDYLNTKRASFPRFYFISDDELLSILGSSNPSSIQVHLLKLFDSVKTLRFNRANNEILGMISSEGEECSLSKPVPIGGAVEVWISAFEQAMRTSLQKITKEGVYAYVHTDRKQWLHTVLGMVSLSGNQIWWTWEVEDAFEKLQRGEKHGMKHVVNHLGKQLNELVALVRDPLSERLRQKINTLLIIDSHARDVVEGFVHESVLSRDEFAWQSQLRFYWDRDLDDCVIRQCIGEFSYGYEYMGLSSRLVITPLTDRCYITLTQAMTFKLGGAPVGPAGTGKTETVKDLAKAMAIPCYVINCGEGLDYKAMGAIFSGLTHAGAWGCFDEFNRINIEVLSVVSAQLRLIQHANVSGSFLVDIGVGQKVPIRRNLLGFALYGVFITMNPGYAGRTELPDNLKALFRPVTMVLPNLELICQIMLFSEGFDEANKLAKKMTVLYKLSNEQLSKQFHYDFGLRALKSVLVMAGRLKRKYLDLSEHAVIMRALRDSNMSKLVFEDVALFKGLIGDVFPKMDCPRIGHEELKLEVEKELESRGCCYTKDGVFGNQVDKCIQLYETQLVRHATMIVGPTGGGKSLILDVLRAARLPAEGITVKHHFLNPKMQSISELHGTLDPVTRDWTDGVFSKMFRSLNEPLPTGHDKEFRCIIFDGDVDALWIENMNSVMDDNKVLTLPNGERIRLQSHCALIFETFDLQFASPATVSRCGMVWVDPKTLGYAPFYYRWANRRDTRSCSRVIDDATNSTLSSGLYFSNSGSSSSTKSASEGIPGILSETELSESVLPPGSDPSYLKELFVKYVPACLDLILQGVSKGELVGRLTQTISITSLQMVVQLTTALDAFLSPETEHRGDMEALYLFSLTWSLGASLTSGSRNKFDDYLKSLASGSGAAPPSKESLFECRYNLNTHRWERWKPEPYIHPQPLNFSKIMVPTSDSVAHEYLLSSLTGHRPVVLLGESGTAKTLTVSKHISTLPSGSHGSLVLNFSSGTKSQDVQASVEASISKRSGSVYTPTGGKKLVVFIDDLNVPEMDQYGTQEALALLLFLIGKGCLYDRGKDLTLKHVCDIDYIAAMRPVGGAIDPRLLSLFSVMHFPQPSSGTLELIFSTVLSHQLEHFVNSARECITPIVHSTLNLFQAIKERMPATPSKFHYIFTIRDLSSIMHGLCLADADIIGNAANPDASLIRMWRAECLNVFSDRLVGSDPDVFKGLMEDVVRQTWPKTSGIILADPVLFGDFRNASSRLEGEEAPQVYEDLDNHEHVRRIFEEVLDAYNVDQKPMNLVLFDSALEHATRLHRIIRRPRGHALLVGVGGNGKKSLTRLVAYAAGYSLFEIKQHRQYGEPDFKEDLKSLFRSISSKNANSTIFLLTDSNIVQEGFMAYINNILTTGQVPSLFDKDEMYDLVRGTQEDAQSSGAGDSFDAVWSFLSDRWKEMLHIVLAVSPSGDTLLVRCRNFPGMISATYIDWYQPWPREALAKVADTFIMEDNLSEDVCSIVVEHMVHTHTTVIKYADQFVREMRRYYAVTPADYVDFIGNYHKELKDSSRKITVTTNHLKGGLAKLTEAAATVDFMQTELSEKKIVVDEKMASVQELIAEIQIKSEEVLIQKNDAAIKEEEVEIQAKLITQDRIKANDALMEALPAVEAAAAALSNLDKKDLDEIKGFTNPPQLVKDVCMQVCVLRPGGEKYEESWADARRMAGNTKLLDFLKGYPKDSITGKMMNAVKKYFKNPNLTVENMTSVSKAGTGLLIWVSAIAKYYEVAKNVEPLRERVKKMEISQQKATQELTVIKKLLKAHCDEITELNESLAKANAELGKLQQEASVMTKRISAANRLVTGLAGERKRWNQDVETLSCKKERLLGDCLIRSCFLSYLGAFTADYRHTILEKEILPDISSRGIKMTTPCSLRDLFASEALIQKWSAAGLPTNDHSIQNGILTTRSSRFPLCIDPQHQATTWIKSTHGESLIAKTLNEPDLMKHLELAIQFGRAFLFENVDQDLDPLLHPVLDKDIVQTGSRKILTIGDKEIDWDDNFFLYLTTKLANPVYSPEFMSKTTVINYSVTMDGLEDQLLNVVVAHERAELEESYTALVQEMSDSTQLLASLENRLLEELGSSEGNILDNEKLLEVIEDTKTEADDITHKLKKSENTRNEIRLMRDVYKPVAKRGSIMYFAESCLSSVMSMYETSLDSFLLIYKGALSKSQEDPVLKRHLSTMVETVTSDVYDYTCTGIFERHKLVFSFQMTCMILEEGGKLDRPALDFFLKGDTALGESSQNCPCSWLGTASWKDFSHLTSSSQFSNSRKLKRLGAHFKESLSTWKTWYNLEAPENEMLPPSYNPNTSGVGSEEPPLKLNPMERLCVMRCFRPDRVINTMRNIVTDEMGKKYVQPPVLDYKRIHSQSSANIPLIIILSPGADPQSSIQQVGKSLGFHDDRIQYLSLGQGQGTLAENMIKEGSHMGHWVILQNCHLLISWMKKLEKWLELLLRSPHPEFRLWLTTEPADSFPLGILQRSFKVVTEPADGLKLNMQRIWSSIVNSTIPDECSHHSAYRPCVFVLSFLHAVLLERKKYGKIGWNIKYDFNDSDFNVSRQLLDFYLTKVEANRTETIPWSSLKYLIGETVYGGRVSDNMDFRVLDAYVTEYMGDFLFNDEYQKFYFSREGYDYQLPKGNNTVESFLASVEDLPITSSPSVFGLHPNAEIEYYSEAARSMWSDLLSLQPCKSTNLAGVSHEECIAAISNDISEKIPIQNEDVGSFDLSAIRQSIADTASPTHIVLLQELERWNKLCIYILSTLRDLQRALRGEIGMNDTLDKLGSALYDARLPNIWRKYAPETLKSLGSWMNHFLKRYTQYKNWVDNGTPAVMWLSGLHIPESYLTAVMQTACRAKKWPLDKLTLYTSITDQMDGSCIANIPESGCYISRLYLEGASWDAEKRCLCKQRPKVLIERLPILLVAPIEKSNNKQSHSFRAPVYVTSKRRNAMGNGFVFEADLQTLEHISHWILQGTACVLNDSS